MNAHTDIVFIAVGLKNEFQVPFQNIFQPRFNEKNLSVCVQLDWWHIEHMHVPVC